MSSFGRICQSNENKDQRVSLRISLIFFRISELILLLSNRDENVNDKLAALLSPATLKPFGILALYFFLYQSSGVNVITFYAVAIFQEAGSSFDKYTCTIILGVVRLVFTIVACIALRRVGRRPLSFISGITMAI